MVARKPKGLVNPKVKPVPSNLRGNKVKLQPKCRFCKNLDPNVEWEEHELHICYKDWYNNDVEDDSDLIKCPYFEWVDELKEVVE
ncbi:MAG: hypothetical protein ACRDBY_05100 [Cetobacterium sp.]